ncbi:1,3-beta-glucanosyltransferase gas1 [Aspergillus alliaceus]|uniref:1,3-beta-glucanosyltransferase n=1 Tax=Petromyces alliaceus TaxID=209559 RepID=A0A5N7C645_PETAA|nr:putative 1,3-beta-glucanosyltransferase [Aspergillus alliaceus]KAB8230636.1 putative 1,3-beta-glucanosyltransferase [Aspergillus alliaceus]KAE8389207.1 putative 1,3-beta-glucanosyltransferase [Aspergillus alliaceus]KAF5866673.1 1,3-beta-glucanosyltransferase gas1 [Aspergillus burnettii]
MKATLALAGASLVGSALATLPAIETKGNKLFYSNNGTEFFIRGVAYQQEYSANDTSSGDSKSDYTDPLSDPKKCERDIPYLKELRTNVIRTYAVDPKADHTECMKMLDDAGIYLITDLSAPSESIVRNDPKWDVDLFSRYTSVVDAFANYTNVIGFFAGNEVANDKNNTDSIAFVKAAVRDMKKYVKAKNYRESLLIGYATDDDASIREDLKNYLVCGDDDARIDMFGYNIYEWCGDSSFEKSGYKERTEEFKDFPVPAFFSEYGCNNPKPRKFTDTPVLYGPKMNNVWSGGIVYMYFQEDNDYGLVSLDGDKVKTLSDYSYLSEEIQKATATGVNSASYTAPSAATASCPSVGKDWEATSELPPSPNPDLCSCMVNTLSCVVKDSVKEKDYADTFNYICSKDGMCDGIKKDATKGKYGAYSVCTPKQQLSFVMNQWYKSSGSGNSQACDFNGQGRVKDASKDDSKCSDLLKQAGTAGTGSVTASPTAGSAAAGSTSTSSTSGNAAGAVSPVAVKVGGWQFGAYVMTAFVAGAGMLLL